MLGFLRKYQRFFLVIVFVFVGISFLFYGAARNFTPDQKQVDKEIGEAVDGSKMYKNEIDQMTRFLTSDRLDANQEQRVVPNFFNDGVIRKDFLTSGIGIMLIESYFEMLTDDFQSRFDKFKRFKPYVHHQVPYISAENLWNKTAPSLRENFNSFMSKGTLLSPKGMELLVELYLGQAAFPTPPMRQILMYQQNQFSNVTPDPYLYQGDLNPFRCHSVTDWFGPNFVELVSQVIHNGAIYAKKQGYAVTDGEAKSQLVFNGFEALKSQKKDGENVTEEELADLFQEQLSYLGLSEKAAVSIWKKVMLFRRLVDDRGYSVFLDPLAYKQFSTFAYRETEVDLYQVPKEFQFKDFNTLLKFQLYLGAISDETQTLLPTTFRSIDEIESTYPMLVGKTYDIEYASVDKEEISLNVSVKETWDWQSVESNYALLEETFPEVRRKEATTATARRDALESLDIALRLQVDTFTRCEIVDSHPDWILDHLKDARLHRLQFDLSKHDTDIPLSGINDTERFYSLFENSSHSDHCKRELENTTFDGKTYYRIHIVHQDSDKKILTFAQAEDKDLLQPLLDEKLQAAYLKVRKQDLAVFQHANGTWKDFDEVHDYVGKYLYADLMKRIESAYLLEGNKLKKGSLKEDFSFYTSYFFYKPMKEAKSALFQNKQESTSPSFADQWKLKKNHTTYRVKGISPYFDESLFEMTPEQWSDLNLTQQGEFAFYQVTAQNNEAPPLVKEVKAGQQILSKEARLEFMQTFIKHLKERGAIHLITRQVDDN